MKVLNKSYTDWLLISYKSGTFKFDYLSKTKILYGNHIIVGLQ